MVVASLVAVLAMAHHPSVGSHGMGEAMAELAREATTSAIAHGALIAALGAQVFGFWVLAERLGLHRALARLGLIAYIVGAASLTGAAVISGFITPSFAVSLPGEPGVDLDAAHQVMAYGFHANQALARLGVVAVSVAILGWALILGRRGATQRGIGALGVVVGAVPVLGLLTGRLELTVHGMGLVVLGQAIWNLAIATQLLRRRL